MENHVEQMLPSNVRNRTIIEPRCRWFNINLQELWQYRYLIGQFVYRDFVVHYKQTVLGPIWWLLQPLFMTGIFTVVFSLVAKLPTDELPAPLFYLCGLTLWNFFAMCFLHTAQVFQDNKNIFQKIYFPRLVLPIASVLSDLMRFALQCGLLFLFYFIYLLRGVSFQPDWTIVFLPLLILYVALFAFGAGILMASLTTKYRDFILVLPFCIQLLMYLSVVMFPLSQVPTAWQFYFALNPMVPAIELFRYMCFSTACLSVPAMLSGVFFTVLIFWSGILVFNRIEMNFTDTI